MSDIAAQMLTEALAAQKFTRKFFVVELDFSEASLHELERQFEAVKYALRGGLSSENIVKLTGLWGAYVGEVLRRHCSAEWTAVESLTDESAEVSGAAASDAETMANSGALPVLQGTSHVARPHHQVRLRLEQGADQSIIRYYTETKAALGSRIS